MLPRLSTCRKPRPGTAAKLVMPHKGPEWNRWARTRNRSSSDDRRSTGSAGAAGGGAASAWLAPLDDSSLTMDESYPMVSGSARDWRLPGQAGQINHLSYGGSIMSRIKLVNRASATGTARTLLDQIDGAFGVTPNMFRAVANSPAALQSMWGSFGALGQGVLGARLGEQIAVAVANRNACSYCLSAHTALGRKAGATAAEMAAAQLGQSGDPRTAAALAFALKLVDRRGAVE